MKLEDITLEDIQDFIANGPREEAPQEVVQLLETMEKIRGMHIRFNSRDHIIKHLQKVDGHSYYLAAKFYDMAMEYFYAERQIPKSAWRNIIAEKMNKAITLGFKLAKDTSDITKVVSKLESLAKVLQLDKEDAEEFPEELLSKPFKMYTIDEEMLGLPKLDRYKLAKFIDDFPDLSERERNAIREEAGLIPFKLIKEDAENPRLQAK